MKTCKKISFQYIRASSSNKMLLLKFFLTLVSCASIGVAFDNAGDISGFNYRLPNSTHPTAYDLSLFTRIDLLDFSFRGIVKINIVVDYTTREIILHARKLSISSVQLVRFSSDVPFPVALLPTVYDSETEFLKVATNDVTLNSGDQLLLEIAYNGTLRTDQTGLYRSSYINEDGVRRQVHFDLE